MDKASQHWEILQRVPEELAKRVRAFMVIGEKGDGVMLVTDTGNGYWLGEMKFGEKSREAIEPTRLDVPNLASMAKGYSHILLLDESGQIHAMGQNNKGQLGLGTVDLETHFSPQLIPIPHKLISIRCSHWHSLALTEDGKVWAWGENKFGQVGVPSSTANPHSSPRLIPEIDSYRIIAIECGGFHSLALTDQGEVYAWGWNGYGQLGEGSESSTHTPTKISTPSPVQNIAVGNCHTLLLIQTGEVYACGWNEWGQLGLPTTTKSSASLVKVAGLPSISQIASHFSAALSIAMSTDQRCFVWGCLDNTFGNTLGNITTFIPLRLPPNYSTLDSALSFRSSPHNTPCSVRVESLECLQKTDSETQTETLTEPIRLGDRIAQMFDNSVSNPDVKFELGDQSILAHRSVLQISSAHFNQFFTESSSFANLNLSTPISQSNSNPLRHNTNPSEPNSQITLPPSNHSQTPLITVPIPHHAYPVFHAYIHYLYTGTFQVPTEYLPQLFELAHSHLESDLEQLCLVRMRSTISPETSCLYYQLTERHPALSEFQQDLLQFIADNIFQVFLTDTYKSMDADLYRRLAISVGNIRRKNP